MFFGITLPTAVIIFPIVYITNDVLAEIYGYKKVRSIVFLGFFMNIIAVVSYSIAIQLPAPVFADEAANAFQTVLGSTPRILVASLSAYIVGSLVNAKIMEKMKHQYEKWLMLRCIGSTLFGEGMDALIFITVAFAGTMSFESLVIMIIAQALFKTGFETACYPVTRYVIKRISALEA